MYSNKSNKKGIIIIQQGNIRVEIPTTSQGYAVLREKLKEVSINTTNTTSTLISEVLLPHE